MPLLSKVASFCKNLFRDPRRESDLDDELRAYVDELAQRKIRAGMDPRRARREALLETGGVDQEKERVREQRVGFTIDSCLRDITYAWRGFGRTRGFVAVVVALLGLGIGANAAL